MSAVSTFDKIRSILRSRWTKYIQVAVTLLLILWILNSVDRHVWASVADVSIGTLALTILIFSSAQIFGGLRLAVLIPGSFPWREALAATWAGYFWGNFLPGSVGGDVVRLFKLNRASMKLSSAVGALFLDRLFNLATIGSIVALSALPLSHQIATAINTKLLMMIAAVFSGAAIVIRLLLGTRFRESIVRGSGPFLAIIKSPRRFIASAILSFCNIGVSILAQWILARNLGIEIGFLELAGIICFVTIIVMVPISINGLGLQEASFVTLLMTFGASEEKAVAFSLLVRLLIFGASALAGAVVLFGHAHRKNDEVA